MLLIKTKIGPSKIHGIGLFADEFIPKGTEVWKFVSGFDVQLTRDQILRLPQIAQIYLAKYAYMSKNNEYILAVDHSIFFNHSQTPNTGSVFGSDNKEIVLATYDIRPGEELTQD